MRAGVKRKGNKHLQPIDGRIKVSAASGTGKLTIKRLDLFDENKWGQGVYMDGRYVPKYYSKYGL